jgi:hypothetical protein
VFSVLTCKSSEIPVKPPGQNYSAPILAYSSSSGGCVKATVVTGLAWRANRWVRKRSFGRLSLHARIGAVSPNGLPVGKVFPVALRESTSILVAVLLCFPAAVSASSIILQPWQPLVDHADLVGVIECVTAGEIVARYRIVESWKGPSEGSLVSVRGPASIYEPSLPIVLVGQRLVVAAWRFRPEYRLSSGLYLAQGPGGSLPPFWRDDRPDYFIPSGLHSTNLFPNATGERPRMLGGHPGDIDAFRRDVLSLLALPGETREATVLQALIRWHIRDNRGGSTLVPDSAEVALLENRTNTLHPDSIVAALADFVAYGRPGSSSAAFSVLYMGGGSKTLAYLSSIQTHARGWSGSRLPSAIGGIRRRLGLDPPEDFNPIAVPPKPTRTVLDSMRTLLRNPGMGAKDRRIPPASQTAFETLSVYDPDFVASHLVEWEPRQDASWENEGYGLGSFFAWRCGRDRASNLRRLLRAKDPYVRVAGAIYLSFENETEGVRALREAVNLPGDPGAWAALNLARRGDKEAAARALDSFLLLSGPTFHDVPHRNLQKRLLVLFSNSAAASGVHQPEPWRYVGDQDEQLRVHDDLVKWWNANASNLVLKDPWFDEWKRLKIE